MLKMKDTGLVGGVPLEKAPLTAIKALRGFVDEQGQSRAAGEIVLCTDRFARGLMSNGKAERCDLPKGETVLIGESASEQTMPAPAVEPAAPEAVQPEPEPKKRRSKFAKGSE